MTNDLYNTIGGVNTFVSKETSIHFFCRSYQLREEIRIEVTVTIFLNFTRLFLHEFTMVSKN